MQQAKSYVKSSYVKMSSAFESIKNRIKIIKNWFKRKIIKHWRKLIIISIVLACLILTALTVLYSFKGVSYLNQAIIVNWSQSQYYQGQYSNQVIYVGLGSTFLTVPNTKFLVQFSSETQIQSQGINNKQFKTYIAKQQTIKNPIIKARVSQGTLLEISASIKTEVTNSTNLKNFFEQYGQDWYNYLSGKIKNVIIQEIAKLSFYELNNKVIKANINLIFTNYIKTISKFPFKLNIINIRINYPTGSFSVTNSLGAQLLKAKSLLNQLQTQYNNLLLDRITFENQTKALQLQKGKNEGLIKGRQLSRYLINGQWLAGLTSIQSIFSNNSTLVDQYLWNYFQSVYNSTYKLN